MTGTLHWTGGLLIAALAPAILAAQAPQGAPGASPGPTAQRPPGGLPGPGGPTPELGGGPPGQARLPADARAGAPIDLTGQWVSIVTEDWLWRMVTPAKGDTTSVPLSPAGTAAAKMWNLDADNAAGDAGRCKAFGVGGITRQPGRLQISWADGDTLKVDYDAGQQSRLLHFVMPQAGGLSQRLTFGPPQGARSLQGESRAQWFRLPQSRGLGFGARVPRDGGALRVVTRNHTGGYLRKNGVPYSPDALITEQWNRFSGLEGDEWLTIVTIVDDPQNLTEPFITSTNFHKEANTAKWNPHPCATPPPF